ncbi:MAG: MMPL family transporter [Solirubrobacterales bacterium]
MSKEAAPKRRSRRRSVLVVVGWIVLLALALPLSGKLSDRVSNGGFEPSGSDSERVEEVLRDDLGRGDRQQLVVIFSGGQPPGAVRRQAAAVAASLRRQRTVVGVAPLQLRPKGGTALLPFTVAADLGEAQKLVPDLQAAVSAAPGPDEGAIVGGEAAVYEASTEVAKDDLAKAERIALPVALVILAIAFLSLVAAAVPIMLAICAITVTFALLAVVADMISMSVYVANIAILLGLGLSIDYSLFYLTRYREMLSGGDSREAALAATRKVIGRAVIVSGATIAVSLSSLLAVGVELFSSMAIGATVAAFVAVAVASTLTPALIDLLGERLDRGRIRRAERMARSRRLWQALATVILRHRVRVFLAALALLLALTVPLASINLGFPGASTSLVGSDDLQRGTESVERDFGPGTLGPFTVVTRADPGAVLATVRSDPGTIRAAVEGPPRGGWTAIAGTGRYEANSAAARTDIERLRDRLRDYPDTYVGGPSALGLDLTERIEARFPRVILIACALTFALLTFAFRSLVIPLKAVLTNVLATAASLGALVLAFQGLGGSEDIAYFVPLFLFALLFGLSMDYEIFILSRIRQSYMASGDNDRAVRDGLVGSGRAITLAALAMIIVFMAGAASHLEPFRQFGIGMTIAIALDATVVRCLLVPSAVAIMGRANWWFPRRPI